MGGEEKEGRQHAGSFVLRFIKGWEFRGGLREDCNRIFISFSRCALSGSWSPLLIGQSQSRDWGMGAGGLFSYHKWSWNRSSGFAAFLYLKMKYN